MPEVVLQKFVAYLQERANLLNSMEMCVEKRIRMDEFNKLITNLDVQLQREIAK